jgi:hypothetical protein
MGEVRAEHGAKFAGTCSRFCPPPARRRTGVVVDHEAQAAGRLVAGRLPVGQDHDPPPVGERVGCTNSISRRLFVLVEESAEEVAPSDFPSVKVCCGWRIGSAAMIRRS